MGRAAAKQPPTATNTKPKKAGIVASYAAVTFQELPGWREDDQLAALRTFGRSCGQLIKTLRSGGSPGKIATPPALLSVCDAADRLLGGAAGDNGDRSPGGQGQTTTSTAKTPSRKQARAFFETHFTPHRVLHNGPKSVLTGYYEPLLRASRSPQGKFQTPIFKRPADLVNIVSEADRAGVGNGFTHARKTAEGLEPYAKRAEIEQGALKGQGLELLYLADPVDAFFLQIQGSGLIKLEDGTTTRVTYDGKNGHPYSSIGRYLIKSGVMGAKTMSLQALGKWLKADKERGRKVMWHNESFVFFRELTGAAAQGAHGVMEVQLTPGRSLAIDPRYHALGLPIYVCAPDLRHVHKNKGFHRLMVGQDVGSAIKGPERGDIFFGSGARAGKLAGVTKARGTYYVLLPKIEWAAEVKTAPRAPAAAPATAAGKRTAR